MPWKGLPEETDSAMSKAKKVLPHPGWPYITENPCLVIRSCTIHWIGGISFSCFKDMTWNTSTGSASISPGSGNAASIFCADLTSASKCFLVLPEFSQSTISPFSASWSERSRSLISSATPTRQFTTFTACLRPTSSLSGTTITRLPFSQAECSSFHCPEPPLLVVAKIPSSLSLSAHFSPSTIHTAFFVWCRISGKL